MSFFIIDSRGVKNSQTIKVLKGYGAITFHFTDNRP